jgi:aminoglycoside phosphotransferase (APT) family kinase protein
VPKLAGIVDWDQSRIGDQASDLASIAVTTGWPLAERIDTRHRGAARPLLANAKIIAATHLASRRSDLVQYLKSR